MSGRYDASNERRISEGAGHLNLENLNLLLEGSKSFASRRSETSRKSIKEVLDEISHEKILGSDLNTTKRPAYSGPSPKDHYKTFDHKTISANENHVSNRKVSLRPVVEKKYMSSRSTSHSHRKGVKNAREFNSKSLINEVPGPAQKFSNKKSKEKPEVYYWSTHENYHSEIICNGKEVLTAQEKEIWKDLTDGNASRSINKNFDIGDQETPEQQRLQQTEEAQ